MKSKLNATELCSLKPKELQTIKPSGIQTYIKNRSLGRPGA